jgi:UDP-N-acetylmuramyl pentapeptide phosphotransferase/UDP-N-acetylglucosamine-1-phosphate transferase
MTAATFTLLAYVAGHAALARYLQVIFVRGASELPVFAAALVGASLGFLWYNAHPAQVFMGDTGWRSAGCSTVALITRTSLSWWWRGLLRGEGRRSSFSVLARRTGQRVSAWRPSTITMS